MQSCGYFFELSNSTFSTTAAAGPQLNAPSPSKTTVDPSSSSTKFALSGCIVFTVTMFYLPLFLSQDRSNSNQLCPKFPFIPSILFPILSSVQDLVALVFRKKILQHSKFNELTIEQSQILNLNFWLKQREDLGPLLYKHL